MGSLPMAAMRSLRFAMVAAATGDDRPDSGGTIPCIRFKMASWRARRLAAAGSSVSSSEKDSPEASPSSRRIALRAGWLGVFDLQQSKIGYELSANLEDVASVVELTIS
jgi:hypothetical protein